MCAALILPALYANNITVSNVTTGTQNLSGDTLIIQFDISWDNSWSDSVNYDAAWVFVKYSLDSGATWNHATLKTSGTNPSGFSQGSGTGLDIVVPTDKKGAFLQRSATGSGTVSATSLQLVWDYGANAVTDDQAGHPVTTLLRVLAVEMVYIPGGSYDLGDGSGSSESTNAFHASDNTKVTIGTSLIPNIKVDGNSYDDTQLKESGIGIDGDGGLDTDNDGVIDNASYPTGYSAFYVMKYELSQSQYRDFLNMLTRTQQNAHTASQVANQFALSNTASVDSRNSLRVPASVPSGVITFGCDMDADGVFDETTDGEWIACNYLHWGDVTAYADWAGLRPMTELEYEKACRGTATAVLNEYAWGSTTITQATGIANSGKTNETSSNDANCTYGNHASVQGPLRSGAFADASSTRQNAGASYYGVMELGGNVQERCVTLGNSTGRSFTGIHGDGALDADGNTDVINWPGASATGSGFRGGDWFNTIDSVSVSYRGSAASTDANRAKTYGGRVARSAP